MPFEQINFSDDVEMTCSGRTLTVLGKSLAVPGRILMSAVFFGSVIVFVAALALAVFLPCSEISLKSILLAVMFLLLAIAPLNGIFFSSILLFGVRVKINFEGDMPLYRFRSGLFCYSQKLDGTQKIVIAPVSGRGDWGFCAYIPTKTFLKYLLPTVPMFPILTSRLVGSKRKALKEAEALSDKLTQFGIQTQIHSSWQTQRRR